MAFFTEVYTRKKKELYRRKHSQAIRRWYGTRNSGKSKSTEFGSFRVVRRPWDDMWGFPYDWMETALERSKYKLLDLRDK